MSNITRHVENIPGLPNEHPGRGKRYNNSEIMNKTLSAEKLIFYMSTSK